jgi:acetylornithine deacetylase/succinyl-diaminopimelate desuccinylase-like protein
MWACAEWLVNHCRRIGLDARLCPTNCHPIVVAKAPASGALRRGKARKRHFLVYGHYDVQPAEPLELWETPPTVDVMTLSQEERDEIVQALSAHDPNGR